MVKAQKMNRWMTSGLLGGLVVLLVGAGYFYLLELKEFVARFELWQANVISVNEKGWQGYRTDTCSSHSHAACSCVVLIHGLADNALTWKKILAWPQSEWAKFGLQDQVTLYAFDLPGSGGTPPPRVMGDYRVRRQAQELRQILNPLCNHWIVVGNSLGGWVGAWLALDWPQGVERLILVDSAGLKETQLDQFLTREPSLESLQEFQRRAYFRPRTIANWQWNLILEHLKKSHVREIAAAQVDEDYLDTKISTLKLPILLLWGKADRVFPLSTGYQLRSLVPRAVWREVSECGHLPQKECPVAIIQAISDMIHFGSI